MEVGLEQGISSTVSEHEVHTEQTNKYSRSFTAVQVVVRNGFELDNPSRMFYAFPDRLGIIAQRERERRQHREVCCPFQADAKHTVQCIIRNRYPISAFNDVDDQGVKTVFFNAIRRPVRKPTTIYFYNRSFCNQTWFYRGHLISAKFKYSVLVFYYSCILACRTHPQRSCALRFIEYIHAKSYTFIFI